MAPEKAEKRDPCKTVNCPYSGLAGQGKQIDSWLFRESGNINRLRVHQSDLPEGKCLAGCTSGDDLAIALLLMQWTVEKAWSPYYNSFFMLYIFIYLYK